MEEIKKNTTPVKGPHKYFGSIFSIPAAIGLAAGGILAYIYYIKIGCVSGTCPITSNPWLTTIWGAAVGYLVGDMFKGEKM